MGDAQHALEEIRPFDRLAKDDRSETRTELGVLLDASAVEIEELLVLVVPVRAALSRLQILEMPTPSSFRHLPDVPLRDSLGSLDGDSRALARFSRRPNSVSSASRFSGM